MYSSDGKFSDGSRDGRTLRGFRAMVAVGSNVLLLGLTSLVTDVSSEMVASVLPVYLVVHLHMSPLAFGLLDGLYQGGASLLRVVSGFVTDRSRRYREIAAVGYALSAVCKLGLLAVGGAWSKVAAVLVIDRFGKGIRTSPRDALISMSAPPERIGTSFGVHRALDTAGALLGPIVAFGILRAAPNAFDAVFVTSFFVAVVGLGILLAFVRNPVRNGGAAVDGDVPRATSLRTVLKTPGARALLVSTLALGAVTASDAFIYLMLQRRVRFDPSNLPLLYVATPLAYMLLAVPAGRAADRFGPRRVLIAGYACLLSVYGIVMLPAFGLGEIALCVSLLGAYYACTDGTWMILAAGTFSAETRGSGMGLVAGAHGLARLCAGALVGALWNAFDLPIAVAAMAGGLLVAMVVASRSLRDAKELRSA